MKKFKVGDKVKIPTTKSVGTSLERCSLITNSIKSQKFAYIVRIEQYEIVLGSSMKRPQSGFLECDLEFYFDEPQYEIY